MDNLKIKFFKIIFLRLYRNDWVHHWALSCEWTQISSIRSLQSIQRRNDYGPSWAKPEIFRTFLLCCVNELLILHQRTMTTPIDVAVAVSRPRSSSQGDRLDAMDRDLKNAIHAASTDRLPGNEKLATKTYGNNKVQPIRTSNSKVIYCTYRIYSNSIACKL